MNKKLTPEQVKTRRYKFGGFLILLAAAIGLIEYYLDAPNNAGEVGGTTTISSHAHK